MRNPMVNSHWLRRKATDQQVKGLFRAARGSDYAAALALLDRLAELGHDTFADELRQVVTAAARAEWAGWSNGYRARWVSWRVDEFMCGVMAVARCDGCGKVMLWDPNDLPPPGWMLDLAGAPVLRLYCPQCHHGLGRASVWRMATTRGASLESNNDRA